VAEGEGAAKARDGNLPGTACPFCYGTRVKRREVPGDGDANSWGTLLVKSLYPEILAAGKGERACSKEDSTCKRARKGPPCQVRRGSIIHCQNGKGKSGQEKS